MFFFVKQKTAYEMRISDWSSDVCSSDLDQPPRPRPRSAADRHHLGPHGRRGQPRDPGQAGTDEAAAGLSLLVRRRLQGHEGICRLCGGGAAAGGDLHLSDPCLAVRQLDRKSVVEGKSVSVRVDLGCRRIIKKKKKECT